MALQIAGFTVGPFQENSYLLFDDSGAAIFIDPGDAGDQLWQQVTERGLRIEAILLTHAHLDHVGALTTIREHSGAPVYLHPADDWLLAEAHQQWAAFGRSIAPIAPAEHQLADGQLLDFGFVRFQVIATPGHTPGGVCFWSQDEQLLIAGDTLFQGSIGRTDLPGGDTATLISSIRERLFSLPDPDQISVLAGHGEPTLLGEEKRHNPFVGEHGAWR